MAWPRIDEVTENLSISDIYAAKNAKLLAEHGITHILSLLSFATIEPVPSGVRNLKLDILDYEDENILDEFKITNRFIDEALEKEGKVLIHCQAGISRSSTVLCAYLMKSLGLSREDAFAKISAVRSIVRPNPGFWRQLQVYEECGHDPHKGHPAYDRWEADFYRWGGDADPSKAKL